MPVIKNQNRNSRYVIAVATVLLIVLNSVLKPTFPLLAEVLFLLTAVCVIVYAVYGLWIGQVTESQKRKAECGSKRESESPDL